MINGDVGMNHGEAVEKGSVEPGRRETENKKVKKRKALAPASFYPSRGHGGIKDERQIRVDSYVLEYMRRLKQKASLQQRDVMWRQFHTQQEAFDFADQEDPDGEYLRVFSQELESNGSRKFLVSSYVEFWRRYKDIPEKFRHFYEIIREGWPCHAYFDLEFSKEYNQDLDGDTVVRAFFSLLRNALKVRLGIVMDDKWIIEFDSSSDVKFSRHVVVRLPGAAFLDNSHVGHFAHEIVCDAMKQRETSKFSRMMFVKNKHGQETTFIDTGVYSRNRAFRLFLSSKAGKNVPLIPTERMMDAWSHTFPDEKIFMHSLVSNIDPMARLLTYSAEGEVFKFTEGTVQKSIRSVYDAQRGSSPYPKLDTFIVEVCRYSLGDEGARRNIGIRSWVSMDNESIIVYNLSGYRYCNNIGREHKSNGVFIVVDLHEGIWYQKCYDPDCKGYRSSTLPVNADIYRDYLAIHEQRGHTE
jgi:DNA-directed primase/polymerase protein